MDARRGTPKGVNLVELRPSRRPTHRTRGGRLISRAAPTAARLAASYPNATGECEVSLERSAETPNISNLDTHERGSGRPALAGARALAFGPPGSELARA